MGVIIGLTFGIGMATILGVYAGVFPPPAQRSGASFDIKVLGLRLGAAVGGSFMTLFLIRNLILAVVVGAVCAFVPGMVFAARHRKRVESARDAWPDVLDDVVSGLRAGLGVGEALASLADRGPQQMRPAFSRFSAHLHATGRLDACLDRLKDDMRDPVADRVAEAMRLASRLGGHDLASMMERLASNLRAENRTRGELLARQSWTVNGARIAAIAPWIVVTLLATRPGTVDAYSSAAGTLVLLIGFGATLAAYFLMLRLGRLPQEPRVLAGEDR